MGASLTHFTDQQPTHTYTHTQKGPVQRRETHSRTMRTTVVKGLAALLCALTAVCAEIAPMKDFTPEKIAGKWYNVGLATNSQWFVSYKSGMKMGTAKFVPTTGGDLDLTYYNLKADGSCWIMTNLAKKTTTPGRFTFHNRQWNNDNDLRVVAASDDYAMVHTIKTKQGVTEVLNHLYSRIPEVTESVKQKFTQFSLDTGVLSDNIVFLPKNAECPGA